MLLVGAIVFLVFNLVLMVTRRLYIETDEMGDIVSRNAMELQAVFRTTSVGFGIMVNRIFKEVNEAYCRIIGYSRDELIGQRSPDGLSHGAGISGGRTTLSENLRKLARLPPKSG